MQIGLGMRIGSGLLAMLIALNAGFALADVVTGKVAKKTLFTGTKLEVQVQKFSFLTDEQAKILGTVASEQPYYGAIAVSPDEGLMSEATIAAANYHTVEAASIAALAGCDAVRKGSASCVIVAVVRPRGWEVRPLQLSSDATGAFRKDYSGAGGALAVSASTGTWGIAKGENAAESAIAACAAKLTGLNDCSVVVAD